MKRERLEELVRTYGPLELDADFARLRGLILAVERETVERCANWHESQAAKWDAKGDHGSMTSVRAHEHRTYAASLRALLTEE